MSRAPRTAVTNDKQVLRNRECLSNHRFEHRLPLEPEWTEAREHATNAAQQPIALWKTECSRTEKYGEEAGLEEKFKSFGNG
jgi:hypothetical protein